MSPTAKTVFTGDAHDLEAASKTAARSVKTVETAAGRADKNLSYLGNRADQTKKKLVGFGNATSLAFGAAGLAYAVKSSVDAFKDAEVQAARVASSLRVLGIENATTKKGVEDSTLALQRLSGFQDDDLQRSFSTILRSTQDYTKSLHLNALAADIARGSGKDLNAVSVAVAKVADGNVAALGRYGVKAEKGATATDVLAAAQKRYAGQAAAYGRTVAGQADIAAGEFNNLQEKIGETFAPLLNQAAGGVLSFSGAVDTLASSVGGFGTVFAGVGGFGALQLAVPVLGRVGKGIGNISTLTKVAGGGFKGFGQAVGATIGPMGAASIGAGLLAAGVYEIWKNSESADQAARGLTDAITGLAGAQDQAHTASDNLKLSRINARKADEALAEQQRQNRSLHNQVVQDTRAETQAVTSATRAKKDHGTSSKEYNDAYRVAAAAISKADGTQKAYTKGLKNAGDLAVYASIAHGRLKSAQDATKISAGGVADAQDQVDRKTRDVIAKSQEYARAATRGAAASYGLGKQVSLAGIEADAFARLMLTAADGTDKANVKARTYDRAVANLAKSLGRLPTQKEIKVVQKYVSQGLNLDQIKAKLDVITSKVVTVTTRESRKPFSVPPPNPVNPTQRTPAAGGGFVSGRYSDGDRHHVIVAGEEAILNPKQIALADSGVPVLEALRMTGAPMIGGGGAFQSGSKPRGRRARDGRHGGLADLVRKGGKWYIAGYGGLLGPLDPSDFEGSLERFVGRGVSPAKALAATEWWNAHYSNGVVYDDVGHEGGATPIKTQLSQAGLPTPGKVPPKSKAAATGTKRSGKSGPVDRRPAWLKRFEESGKLDGQGSYENALARAEANLADANRTPARIDDIRATHALIRLSSRWLGQLHGPIRGAHREPVWQRAVNEAITSTSSTLAGYRSGLTDLVRRPGPDDVEVKVPSAISWGIEKAGFSESTSDDVTAQTRKANWLKAQLNAKDRKGRYLLPLKSAKRIAYSRELARTNAELAALGAAQTKAREDDATAAEAAAGIAPDLPIGVQEALANAALTPDTADDLAALDLERRTLEQQINEATDPRVRVALKGDLAGVLGSIASLNESVTGKGAGPTADESAVAAQLNSRIASQGRALEASEAFARTAAGAGDLNFGGGLRPSVVIQTLHPGDPATLQAVADAATRGFNLNANVSTSRSAVSI